MRRGRAAAVLALSVAAVSACASRKFVYEPAVSSSAVVEGRPASYYPIPPEAPRGDVRIATFGFADISPEGSDEEIRALHLRMVIANNSDAQWVVDTRDQRVLLPRDGESRPAFANVDEGTAPVVEIPPGGKRTLDLFYPLPPHLEKASELPSFDTVWRVQTQTGTVAQRTPFERLDVTPAYYGSAYPYAYGGYGWGYGWGPPYYYDPWYARGGAFVGVRLAPSYYSRPVVIQRNVARPPPARRVR